MYGSQLGAIRIASVLMGAFGLGKIFQKSIVCRWILFCERRWQYQYRKVRINSEFFRKVSESKQDLKQVKKNIAFPPFRVKPGKHGWIFSLDVPPGTGSSLDSRFPVSEMMAWLLCHCPDDGEVHWKFAQTTRIPHRQVLRRGTCTCPPWQL